MLRPLFLQFIIRALAQSISDSEFKQDWAATTAVEMQCVFPVAYFATAVASVKVGTWTGEIKVPQIAAVRFARAHL